MITILAFLFVLGVLIFVHELGHFLAARRHGVRVITFSLGFGPKILKVTRGDTEYCISAIPLGGYVKMAGENPEDPRSGHPDEFLSKTKWQRFQILFAGPAMNILLAVVVTAFVLGIQGVVLTFLIRGNRTRLRRGLRSGALIGVGSVGAYLLVLFAFQVVFQYAAAMAARRRSPLTPTDVACTPS